jgi:hypothetical protein
MASPEPGSRKLLVGLAAAFLIGGGGSLVWALVRYYGFQSARRACTDANVENVAACAKDASRCAAMYQAYGDCMRGRGYPEAATAQ